MEMIRHSGKSGRDNRGRKETSSLKETQGLCATIYTQVSDVEEEINGLLTYDRKVCKVSPDRLRDLADRLQEAITI